ncbi:MAG: hypothetical protein WBV94_09050 [Blastocatellia bacterium]
MYTFGQLLFDLSKLPHGAGVDTVILKNAVNATYREILDKFPWTRLEKSSSIQTVAIYETGTVAVTQGSTAITGTGTVWTTGMTGRRFRIDGREEFYTFTRTGNGTGTTERTYEGEDDGAASYRIFDNIVTLPSDLRVLESIKVPSINRDLDQIGREQLDQFAPARLDYGPPEVYAPFDDSAGGLPQIELYPIPETAEGLPIRYRTAKARLVASGDTLPEWMSEECLKTGVEAYLYGLAGDVGMRDRMRVDFLSLLADQKVVDIERMEPQQMRMASRFTRHRRARAWGNDDDDELEILRRS